MANTRMSSLTFDVSVIVPFGDDEDVIGRAARRLSTHLREMGLSFELLFVDEDSRDNSHALLSLLGNEVPELSLHASGRGRGAESGVAAARGAVLWIVSAQAAAQTLSPFGGAYRRIAGRELDLVVVEGRYSVARRTQVLDMVSGMRGGPGIHERLAKKALGKGLRVERHRLSGGAANRADSPWSRLMDTSPFRAALSWIDSES